MPTRHESPLESGQRKASGKVSLFVTLVVFQKCNLFVVLRLRAIGTKNERTKLDAVVVVVVIVVVKVAGQATHTESVVSARASSKGSNNNRSQWACVALINCNCPAPNIL
jgi:hypothetical protein